MAPDPTIAKVAKLVGLSKAAATKLQREAERRRVPSAQVLRRTIQAGIDSLKEPSSTSTRRAPKPFTRKQRAALESFIGMGKGLPRDLSTNPKHMNGFGESPRD